MAKLIAETKQSDLGTKNPRCSIGIEGGDILFHTTKTNAHTNAIKLMERWNAFEKDGSVTTLLAANERILKLGYIIPLPGLNPGSVTGYTITISTETFEMLKNAMTGYENDRSR